MLATVQCILNTQKNSHDSIEVVCSDVGESRVRSSSGQALGSGSLREDLTQWNFPQHNIGLESSFT
jgi:hypothetical protein